MSDETRSIGPICADLKAKGEKEAAFVLDRVAYANAELGEVNVELLEALEDLLGWQSTAPDSVKNAARQTIAKAKGKTE